nr:uncharacterized protein LOC128700948 isoform X2 [Cherax quadricarinatus]
MKVVRCEWAPSLVVEWLSGELEERGIPGPIYAHTLLSLLHHHYCPHPAPTTPCTPYHHLDDFDLRDLDDLGRPIHPDADLPDLLEFTSQQEGVSRRARKRHKARQKQRPLTSEQLQKLTALRCLMSASDERYELESLVEELCSRLKSATNKVHLNASNGSVAVCTKQVVGAGARCTADLDDYTSSSTPEEQAERYYAAFPPLGGSCKGHCLDKSCKTGHDLCPCVWEGKKSSFVIEDQGMPGSTVKMQRTHRKKCREKDKREAGDQLDDLSRGHLVPFTWRPAVKHKEALFGESYDTDSASETERNLERRRKKFTGPLLDEDIGEGYIGDTSSRESSEDRDKGDQDVDKAREEKCDKTGGNTEKVKRNEEWECMGDLLLAVSGSDSNDQQGGGGGSGGGDDGGGGSRLFERGSTTDGSSSSSSDSDTQEAESVRQLEEKICSSVAQVWGQGECGGHSCGDHVWDPPGLQDMPHLPTVWGLNLAKANDTCIAGEHGSDVAVPAFTPVDDAWHRNHSWHHVNPITEEDPLCTLSNQSPICNFQDNSKDSTTLLHLHNSLQKSIWSDYNANNISGNEGTLLVCMDDYSLSNSLEPYQDHDRNCHTTEELENKLCESFMQMGLENIWDNTLGLEGVFAEFSVSTSNLECPSENSSHGELTQDSQTDSEHEKMMALVEDVCKSYESQEEVLTDSSAGKPVPSGPSGPQADLRHTENSGFSMVIPRGKSAEPAPSVEQAAENLLGSGGDASGHEDALENVDALPTTHEEENLLTSPRTHFRPIRQDSIGSTADDHYEDGTMFMVNSERPDLPFQRTSSGTLFLESDILEGSPKKYMVYKEPVLKIVHTEEQEVVAQETVPLIALVPKFKVVNNEKFCQTEEDTSQSEVRSLPLSVDQKVSLRERTGLKDHFPHKCDEQEPDVFGFQQQDFPDSNLASIWKSEAHLVDAAYSQNIWQVQAHQERDDTWPRLNDPETGGIVGNSWVEREREGATGWSSEGHFEPQPERNVSAKSQAVVIPTSLASLWHRNNSSASPSIPSSMTSLQALWSACNAHANEDSECDVNRANMYVISNPTTYIPGKLQDNHHMIAGLTQDGPWKPVINVNKSGDAKNDKIWSESSRTADGTTLSLDTVPARSVIVGVYGDAPEACTELRLEVQQEADELLGAVHAHTSHESTMHPDVVHSLLADESHSLPPLHERLKKYSCSNPVSKTASCGIPEWRSKPASAAGAEREDLDDLAPDWQLNDGFEWGPQSTTSHLTDCDDRLCEKSEDGDDDCEGGEVIVYDRNSGTTYTIPVQYLDDTLYDEVFGARDPGSHCLGAGGEEGSGAQCLGGSLPDLPLGAAGTTIIHYSNVLEDQWKNSGIPYKVQVPRKGRAGRWLPPWRRPCTFFMEGSCRRSDCRFSHDLASITCRFWQEGACLKGITCPFLHGYPVRRRRNKSEGAAHSERDKMQHHSSSFEIDSEMDFPALGSSCDSKNGSVEDGSYMMGSSGSSGGGGGGGGGTGGGGTGGTGPAVTRKKKRRFIAVSNKVLDKMKSEGGTDGAGRRECHHRHYHHHHHHHHHQATTIDLSVATTTTTTTTASNQPAQHTLRAKRHRATASGHDDGTVSDY